MRISSASGRIGIDGRISGGRGIGDGQVEVGRICNVWISNWMICYERIGYREDRRVRFRRDRFRMIRVSLGRIRCRRDRIRGGVRRMGGRIYNILVIL